MTPIEILIEKQAIKELVDTFSNLADIKDVAAQGPLFVEISSVVYSISRRILKHEHAQKHPPHPAPPPSHLAGLHAGEGKRDYLFVAIDDFSRGLYAAILPDKTTDSAAKFLTEHLIDPCPYLIECVYSDNGTEYKGSANHAFGVACYENGIGQKFTRVARPQTNGKAERVIRTLMEMWHEKQSFESLEHRRKELCRFVNFYNTVKPHRRLNGDTPFEVLQAYFSQPVV